MNRRVAVTGIGVYCACGKSRAEFWDSMTAGRSAIGTLEGFPQVRFPHAAQIRGHDPQLHFTPKEIDLLDPFAQYALIAAAEAVKDSGVEWTAELRESTGVITGSCVG
ncbi:MAG: beta-ACP synthase, partial [Bryobacterales bacterium]|nr:beta-ACP synthase [Bryobacterales bacterium]